MVVVVATSGVLGDPTDDTRLGVGQTNGVSLGHADHTARPGEDPRFCQTAPHILVVCEVSHASMEFAIHESLVVGMICVERNVGASHSNSIEA